MRIGILGTGNMADALATQWVRAGHQVMIGGRSPEKAARLAKKIGAGAVAGRPREAAGYGQATLLVVHHEGVLGMLDEAGAGEGSLAGRALIDCTDPVVHESWTLWTGDGPSMARRIAAAAPGAHVVKAFNLCHVDVWRRTPPAFGGRPLAVPLCGDDAGALETVRTLVTDMGCVPLDGGGLDRAGLLEATAVFLIGLWFGGADPITMLPPVEAATGG